MKVIMIDVDGVLLDKEYQITTDLSAMAAFLRNSGTQVEIVPNSDTPVERLERINFGTFGFKPRAIIAEKGAFVKFNGISYPIANVTDIDDFILGLKKVFTTVDCDVVIGDSATWIREKKVFSPNRRMLIIDALRKQSVGFYLRTTDASGIPRIDNAWFTEGKTLVETIPIPKGLEAKDYNESYGIVIMGAANADKTSGFQYLKGLYPTDTKFFMVGDGDSDIIRDAQVIMCSVGNGSQALKDRSTYISGRTYTEGLLDCLEWIKSN